MSRSGGARPPAERTGQGAAHGRRRASRGRPTRTLARVAELIAGCSSTSPTPCVGCLPCCIAWGSVRRCRPTAPANVTRTRLPPDGRRRGRGIKVAASCGARSVLRTRRWRPCARPRLGPGVDAAALRWWRSRVGSRSRAWSGVRPAQRPRLIYRALIHRGGQGEPGSVAETDYTGLLDCRSSAARWADRADLGQPGHPYQCRDARVDRRRGLAAWSHRKRSLGNLTVHGIDHLAANAKNRLKRIQHRPATLRRVEAANEPTVR
jgi:hypothetical protein